MHGELDEFDAFGGDAEFDVQLRAKDKSGKGADLEDDLTGMVGEGEPFVVLNVFFYLLVEGKDVCSGAGYFEKAVALA